MGLSKKFKVLVCLASYKGYDYLIDQLNSIHNQIDCEITILISDDHSDDHTFNLLNDYSKAHKNIFLLKNKFHERGSNTNFYSLIIEAKNFSCDFVAFSDQDDIFFRDKFIKQIELLSSNEKVVGCSTSVECFGFSETILVQSPKITDYDFLFEGAGQGCSFLLKKSFFDDFSNYVEKNYELVKHFLFHDWLCYLFCRASNKQWFFMREPLVKYRIHNHNSFGNKYSLVGTRNRVLKLFNGWYYKQIVLANKIASHINPNIPQIFKLNTIKIVFLLFFNSRRKLSDRFIAFFPVLLNHIFKK